MAANDTFIELRTRAVSGYASWITYLHLRQMQIPNSPERIALLVNDLYFTGVGVASQTHAIIALFNLYDREKNDTHNLEHLISCCKKENILTEEMIRECEALKDSVASEVRANVILRGNLFAHSGKSDHAKVFDAANQTIEDAERMFHVAFKILGIIAEVLGTSIYSLAMIEEQVLRSSREIVELLKQSYQRR